MATTVVAASPTLGGGTRIAVVSEEPITTGNPPQTIGQRVTFSFTPVIVTTSALPDARTVSVPLVQAASSGACAARTPEPGAPNVATVPISANGEYATPP